MEEKNPTRFYLELIAERYSSYPFQTKDLGEQMALVEEVITGYWKPRFLIDHRDGCAYEFMSKNEYLVTVTQDDIAWESLGRLPSKAIHRAYQLSCIYPLRIYKFENGIAEVLWQLIPEGQYYMDETGYGMGDGEEINIYGFINRSGKVVVKFQTIDDFSGLKDLRIKAEEMVGFN